MGAELPWHRKQVRLHQSIERLRCLTEIWQGSIILASYIFKKATEALEGDGHRINRTAKGNMPAQQGRQVLPEWLAWPQHAVFSSVAKIDT